MRYLLDTNIISVSAKPQPASTVMAWLDEADEDSLFLSVITLGELRRGVERLPDGQRKRRLDGWLRDELPLRFEDRILGIDDAIADRWGQLLAERERLGRQIGAVDALMAATALAHDLTLVTRNVRDFRPSISALLDPWQPPAVR